MKLLTFAIPCYNSQDYMENCIKSLLPGGDDVEILINPSGKWRTRRGCQCWNPQCDRTLF